MWCDIIHPILLTDAVSILLSMREHADAACAGAKNRSMTCGMCRVNRSITSRPDSVCDWKRRRRRVHVGGKEGRMRDDGDVDANADVAVAVVAGVDADADVDARSCCSHRRIMSYTVSHDIAM